MTVYMAWEPEGAERWIAHRERLFDPAAYDHDRRVHLTLGETDLVTAETVWDRLTSIANPYQLPLFTQLEAPTDPDDDPEELSRTTCPADRLLEEVAVLETAVADPLLRPLLARLRNLVTLWPQSLDELTLRLDDPAEDGEG